VLVAGFTRREANCTYEARSHARARRRRHVPVESRRRVRAATPDAGKSSRRAFLPAAWFCAMKLRKLVTMREALESSTYFGTLLAGDSWQAWRFLLIAIVGEELTEDERGVFKPSQAAIASRTSPLKSFGRRGGKTRSVTVLAAYITACVDHRDVLAPGERGVLPILAASTVQASQAFNFVSGIFSTAPNLKDLLESETADALSLATGIDITIRPASFRTIRGIAAVAVIADEIAFWRSDDSANPDTEILRALRPSLATTGGLLAAISSPHAKRGELSRPSNAISDQLVTPWFSLPRRRRGR
jgi:hypothetical protein